ncbi:MAG TPA: hypothetical protein DDZ51_13075, partial [Planctomycetaceae bacterium]|nr:hypothetical protein [Planctomycetaceae bacterium]
PAGEVNDAEAKLKHLLSIAGFASGAFQQQIRFRHEFRPSPNLSSTTPDVFFDPDPDDPDEMGVCIYLDGMSDHIHGNAKTAAKDAEIRSWLRAKGYHVFEITRVDLDDGNAMRRYFKKLGRLLVGKDFLKTLDENAALNAVLDSLSNAEPTTARTQAKGVQAEPQLNAPQQQQKLTKEYEEILHLVSGNVRKLVTRLAAEGIAAPEPGYPLDDEDGITVAESEMAWPDQLVAYFRKGDESSSELFKSRSWTVITENDLDADVAEIKRALSK